MKLFRTSSIDVMNDCRTNFSFMLPSEMIEIRKAKFEIKFNTCNSLRYYYRFIENIVVTNAVTLLYLLFI